MAEDQRWWQTVPGILTATAATVTAATGLIVALHQAGVLSSRSPQVENGARTSEATAPPPVAASPPRATTPSAAAPAAQAPLKLAAGAEVRVGHAVYKILATQLDPYNVEQRALRFTVRMTNDSGYPDNFWDDSFRLLVDGVPRAPKSGLNKLVDAHSAEEGDVTFVIPAETQSAVLQVRNSGESTDVPVDLSAKAGSAERGK